MHRKPTMQKNWESFDGSHQNIIKAILQINTYWKSSRTPAGSKFGTVLVAATTVLRHLQVHVLVHTQKNYNPGRNVTGNKSGKL